ncbi:MAG: hypothetical protein Q8P69_01385 [bacterium]|nr:hypothetical protein [bacterium]
MNKVSIKKFFFLAVAPPPPSEFVRLLYLFSKVVLSYGWILIVVLLVEGLYSRKFRKTWWFIIVILYLVAIFLYGPTHCSFKWTQGCPVY